MPKKSPCSKHVSIDQPRLNVRPRFLYSCCWMISKDLGIRASGMCHSFHLRGRSTSLVPDSLIEMPNNTIQKLDPRVDLSSEFGKAIWPNSTSARQNYKTPLSARLLKLGLQVCRALDKCPNAKMVCVLNSSSSSRPTRKSLVSLQSK